jgi:AcrR family transcriptional regulator
VPTTVKRNYSSPQREAQATATRASVVTAARQAFLQRGYAGATVSDIAERAGVNIDTVYRSVGRKPQLMVAAIDQALGESDQPLPAEQREYVRAVHAAETAETKLRTYAEALGRIMPRVSPLFAALREAAIADAACAATYEQIATRRAGNMRLLAGELRATGELRDDLDDEHVADLLWSTNAPDWYALVASRGWTPQQYTDALYDIWTRVLLIRRRAGRARRAS